jgi:PAS domain S-box-containing protein
MNNLELPQNLKTIPLRPDIMHLAYDHIPIAVYACDRLGYITYYNPAAAELWKREPVIGRDRWGGSAKIFKVTGEQQLPEECPVAVALRTGQLIEGQEVLVECPDGTRRNIVPHPVPVFDDKGDIAGVINTLTDITERRSGRSKEALLAAIVRSSEDAVISKTLDGVITTWNEAAERMYGYTESEAIGQHITLIIPNERMDEETLIITKIKNGENVEHFETQRLTKKGDAVPVSLTISPIKDTDGRIIGASKIARDISRLKQAEEQLQRYADNLELLSEAGEVVNGSLNIDEILQKVTDVTTKLTGAAFGAFFYNKVDGNGESYMLFTLSGAPREAFEKFGMPRNTAVFGPTFAGQGIVRSDDITKDPRYGHNAPHYGKPKGHLPVVSYLAVPVITKSGDVLGGLFFGHPEPAKFTHEHEQLVSGVVNQAVVALDNAKLYEQIQHLNAKKDEFIGLASHELRTPITSLKGYLQIFEKTIDETDKNKVFINKAVQQVNKLSGLISDLLDVSKIETGKLPLAFTVFDLKKLIEEVIELTQYSSKSHLIDFTTSENELMVSADRQRIEQVIINLISNAIKYSPDSNKVDISLSASSDHAHVSVKDFGMGISDENQQRIFSRFYRVDEIGTHISGLGIGLYISHEIITRHKGTLTVNSEPGKGSCFIFEIPIRG